jgi:hypothetical protein
VQAKSDERRREATPGIRAVALINAGCRREATERLGEATKSDEKRREATKTDFLEP